MSWRKHYDYITDFLIPHFNSGQCRQMAKQQTFSIYYQICILSTLVFVMAWCSLGASHYLNQCWLIMNKIVRNALISLFKHMIFNIELHWKITYHVLIVILSRNMINHIECDFYSCPTAIMWFKAIQSSILIVIVSWRMTNQIIHNCYSCASTIILIRSNI